jgi:hypothetical protein
MADRAIVTRVQDATPDSSDSSITMVMEVKFFSDVGNGAIDYVFPRMLWTDTGTVWVQKITAAIIARGAELGYTLAAAQVRMPSYIAGA